MRLRRCAIVQIEARERLEFDLAELPRGGSGLREALEWLAVAPHLAQPVAVTPAEIAVLGAISPTRWRDSDDLCAQHPHECVMSLAGKGLLIAPDSAFARADDALRATHWRGISAVMHYASRWGGVDTSGAHPEVDDAALLSRLGPPEPAVHEHVGAAARISLAPPAHSALEALLLQRVTCRNFDASRPLARDAFSSVLYRAWAARAMRDYAPDVPLLKKAVPSAGGLHATEAYLLVQHVQDVAPGLYHYHPVDHALEPLRPLDSAEARELARRFVAGQDYFAGAHVLVIAASRFRRTFWKYRDHPKAYRALLFDIGHLSMAQYLAATECGLGAFITAAINEVDIEQAFGLDPLEQGPLAVTGFGLRDAQCREVEWDPLGAVWPKA